MSVIQCYNRGVMRLALVALVGFLAFSTGGFLDLLVPEPCAITESASEEDSDCGPACARCHCGAPVVHFGAPQLASQTPFATDFDPPVQSAASGSPSEILHVPLSS